jgi:hypothetical protein
MIGSATVHATIITELEAAVPGQAAAVVIDADRAASRRAGVAGLGDMIGPPGAAAILAPAARIARP